MVNGVPSPSGLPAPPQPPQLARSRLEPPGRDRGTQSRPAPHPSGPAPHPRPHRQLRTRPSLEPARAACEARTSFLRLTPWDPQSGRRGSLLQACGPSSKTARVEVRSWSEIITMLRSQRVQREPVGKRTPVPSSPSKASRNLLTYIHIHIGIYFKEDTSNTGKRAGGNQLKECSRFYRTVPPSSSPPPSPRLSVWGYVSRELSLHAHS